MLPSNIYDLVNSTEPQYINAQTLIQAIDDEFMLVESITLHFNFNEADVYPSKTRIKIDSIVVHSLHETQKIQVPGVLFTFINKIIDPNSSQIVYSTDKISFRNEAGEMIKYYPYVVE